MLPYSSKFKFYVSFPRLPFFKSTNPHSPTLLSVDSPFNSHFRKANDPFWLPKLPAPAAAWIPKITGAWNNCSLHGQKMSPDPSEQWKTSGERQIQLLQPFKHRTATEQQQQQDGALTHLPPMPLPSSLFPHHLLFCVSSVDFTNLTESNCPIPRRFFLPMKTLQRYTHVHMKLIQLHNNHFLDIIFETSIS